MADVIENKFLIGNATVMLAPFTEDVFSLTPAAHSVGMVKAVTVTEESDQIMLKNGITQTTVDAQKSNVSMTTSFEGYEFSASNLMHSLGLQGSVVKRLRGRLTEDAATGATSVTVESYPVPGDLQSLIDAPSDIPLGSTILLQKAGEPDNVYPCKATAEATGTGPYVVSIEALPDGISFKTGDTFWIMNEISTGSTEQDLYFCAKIVGTLQANDEPIAVFFPKLKVASGFNLSFSETDYSNLPFELTPLIMTMSEVEGRPKLTEFTKKIGKAMASG